MMTIDSAKRVSLYNPCFADMRRDLDIAIEQTIARMDRQDVANGAITTKIEIDMERKTIKDDNSPAGVREALQPRATYKISVVMQTKGEAKGDVIGVGNELVRDDDGAYYVLSREEASGQLSMFNCYDELSKDDDEMEEDDDE